MKKSRWDYIRPYLGWGATIVAVGALVLVVFFCFYKFNALKAGIGNIIQILMPVIYGLIIAYLLAPIYDWFTVRLMRLFVRKMKWKGHRMRVTAQVISMILTFALMFLVIAGLIALLLPRLIASVTGIIFNFPTTINDLSQNVQKLFSSLFGKNTQLEESAMSMYAQVVDYVNNWVQNSLVPQVQNMFSYFTDFLLNALRFVKNLIIGIVVAVYLLANKRRFISQSKKMLYAVFGVKAGNFLMDNIRYADNAFGGFLGGKIVDSAIIGVITGIIMSVMKMPYSLIIAVVIGVTNIIPFFGPFIGAVPCAVLIFIVSPFKAIQFVIFILILQQFDGNVLGPKILGETTGVSSFWVLFSIIFFGGLFGFVGMIIGVPLFALIEHILAEIVNTSLKRQKLPVHSSDYVALHHIDEDSGTVVREVHRPRGILTHDELVETEQREQELKDLENSLEGEAMEQAAQAVKKRRRFRHSKTEEPEKPETAEPEAKEDAPGQGEDSEPENAPVPESGSKPETEE